MRGSQPGRHAGLLSVAPVLRFVARFILDSSPMVIMVSLEGGAEQETNRRRRPVALDIFLKLDGIKGESTDTQHGAEIDVASFSWGLSQQRTTGTGGGSGV